MSARLRPRVRPRTILATLAVTGLLAACSTTATSDDPDTAADGGAPGPGVGDDTVKIGLVTLASADSAGSGGFTVAPQGDSAAQAEALVEHLNAGGGIGGREVELVVREFSSSEGSAQTETALCNSFTQDDEVFAVVTLGQRTRAALDCYSKAETLVVDVSQSAQPASVYEDLSPYLWTPNAVDLDTSTAALVRQLGEDGVFDGAKVGVMVQDEPAYEAVFTDVLAPALAEYDVEPVKVGIDQSTPENAFASAGTAAGKLQQADVSHVMFLGIPDNVGYLTSYTAQQGFFPQLLISSNDNPDFMTMNPPVYPVESLKGARGIAFYPAVDGIADEAFPSAAEQTCVEALDAAGISFKTRSEAKTALRYCDGLTFLHAVGEELGEDGVLNAANVLTAAEAMDGWNAATTLTTDTDGSAHAPAAAFRPLAFQGSAFAYAGDEQSLR